MKINQNLIQSLIKKIQSSRKYRDRGLSPTTIEDLIRQEAPGQNSEKRLLKAVRRKLHNIVAPYLGEPDYQVWRAELSRLPSNQPHHPDVENFCHNMLTEHASTKERLPFLDQIYSAIFDLTGKPDILLDLACGLHPLSFPWMALSSSTHYYAYDIIQPRIDFINTFFEHVGLLPLAANQDILANPPQVEANLAFFFKEAHRFEKRQHGCNQNFWRSLKVKTLIVSLPVENLDGTHSLLDQHRRLVQNNLSPDKSFQELMIGNEVFFLIDDPGK